MALRSNSYTGCIASLDGSGQFFFCSGQRHSGPCPDQGHEPDVGWSAREAQHLPPSTTMKEIREFFDGFILIEVDINKHFALVCLTSDAEAERAVTTLDQGMICGKSVVVKI
jgi:hypothetical protein